jgi:hypothetical protein
MHLLATASNKHHGNATHPVCVDEEALSIKGSDCGKTRQALPIVLEDGREGQRIKALQLTRCGNVQPLHPAGYKVYRQTAAGK